MATTHFLTTTALIVFIVILVMSISLAGFALDGLLGIKNDFLGKISMGIATIVAILLFSLLFVFDKQIRENVQYFNSVEYNVHQVCLNIGKNCSDYTNFVVENHESQMQLCMDSLLYNRNTTYENTISCLAVLGILPKDFNNG